MHVISYRPLVRMCSTMISSTGAPTVRVNSILDTLVRLPHGAVAGANVTVVLSLPSSRISVADPITIVAAPQLRCNDGPTDSTKFVTHADWVCDECDVEHSRDTS